MADWSPGLLPSRSRRRLVPSLAEASPSALDEVRVSPHLAPPVTNSLASSQSETQPSRAERAWLLAGLLIAFFLRFWYAGHFRIDSDEPQHLHVVWGWVSGGLPYRDFFDNHMPLFQAMWAPLMAWFGERADVIVPMRMTEWPVYAGTVWAAGMLGRQLVSVRAGWWTALITALVPRFYLISLEFRPDNLWSLFWLLTLVVLAGGALTARRGLVGRSAPGSVLQRFDEIDADAGSPRPGRAGHPARAEERARGAGARIARAPRGHARAAGFGGALLCRPRRDRGLFSLRDRAQHVDGGAYGEPTLA